MDSTFHADLRSIADHGMLSAGSESAQRQAAFDLDGQIRSLRMEFELAARAISGLGRTVQRKLAAIEKRFDELAPGASPDDPKVPAPKAESSHC